MTSSTRTPPRFVPTLTTVVEIAPEPPIEDAAAPVESAPFDSNAPSLEGGNMIDDLHFAPIPRPRAPVNPPDGAKAVQISEEDAFRLEEQLLHRVLQRVDFSLEERLTDTVSVAVQRQLDSMMPLLRTEIETVLRSLVVEALAQELSETPTSKPPFTPPSLG
jgi:hypothetical protein